MDIERYFISILFLFFCSGSFSQKNAEKEIDIKNFYSHRISLPKENVIYKLNWASANVCVSDVRFDTSCIGITKKSNSAYGSILNFNKSTAEAVKDYFISLIKSDSTLDKAELYCYLKKIVLSDDIFINAEGEKTSTNDLNIIKRSGIMLTIEFYARQNSFYFPLYRFDTTVTGNKEIFSGGENYIATTLTNSLRKLEIVNWEKIKSQGKRLTQQEIDSFYSARITFPVIKENLKKGIYYSFNDFKKNTPVDREFTINKSDKGDFLYIKNEKGEDLLLTDLWGYCDGNNIFIFSAENYFKLYRSNNSFKVYGAKDFTSVRNLRLNFGLLDVAIPNSTYAKSKTAAKYMLKKSWYLLDMDTGELF